MDGYLRTDGDTTHMIHNSGNTNDKGDGHHENGDHSHIDRRSNCSPGMCFKGRVIRKETGGIILISQGRGMGAFCLCNLERRDKIKRRKESNPWTASVGHKT